MPSSLTVGTATAAPGARADGAIPVTRRPGGGSIEIPVIILNGVKDGPVLWIDGPIHGDEIEGPLAFHKLLAEVDPAQLTGAVVIVPILNVAAFEAQERGNPADKFTYDMNRMYPGKPDGYPSERVAYAHYQQLTAVADMVISVHSGGAHSYLAQAQFYNETPAGLELAKAMGPGWDLILKSINPSGNPSSVMGKLGKGGITVELGGMAATLPELLHRNSDIFKESFLNVLRHFKMIAGEAKYEPKWNVGVQRTVLAGTGGYFVPTAGIQYRSPIAEGTVIAEIRDLYGTVLEEVKAPCDGQIFGMRTQPCVYQGDWACFYGDVLEVIE